MQVETYFEDIQHEIKLRLLEATKSIKIAVAYFTDNEIFDILCTKASSGISIELLISDEEVNFKSSNINYDSLLQHGGRFYISINEDKIILHNKFCIIDTSIVITGSYNWSIKAKRNHENIVVIRDCEDVTTKFTFEFERIKSISAARVFNRNAFVLPSGLSSFDTSFGGFYSGTINIFCSNTQTELTSLLLSIANQVIQTEDAKVAFISLAEDSSQTVNRLLSFNSGVPVSKIERGEISAYETIKLYRGASALYDKNFITAELVYPSLIELKEKINVLRYKSNLRLIVIDKIERIAQVETTFSRRNNQHLEPFIIELKRLALETNIPIVCSLAVSIERSRNRPNITSFDLDVIGTIEKHADAVFSLYRPEYYEFGNIETSPIRTYYLRCLKHRHSHLETITLMQNILTKQFTENIDAEMNDATVWKKAADFEVDF